MKMGLVLKMNKDSDNNNMNAELKIFIYKRFTVPIV